MKISHDELMALSPSEREAVIRKLAHPAKARKPYRSHPIIGPFFNMLQSLVNGGRATR
jgi:hypothetical protein